MNDHAAPGHNSLVSDVVYYIGRYRKAIIAFLAPGIVLLAVPMAQGKPPSGADLWIALAAIIAASLGVAIVPNKKKVPGKG